MSAIFLVIGSCLVAILLSLSVQPSSLLDLLIPAKVELKNSNNQIVYTQNVRLNALVTPDELSLPTGQYALYVNGSYEDTLQVTSHAKDSDQATQRPVDQSQAKPASSKVEVKNIDGVQAITWEGRSTQLFSFSLSDNPIMKQLSQHFALWINQEKVFWIQVNEVFFAGAMLLALMLITFHATALASTTVQANNDWPQFLQSGWRYFPYTMVSAIIWSIALVGVSTPLIGLVNTLDFPYRSNIETGIIAIVTVLILIRVSSVVTGAVRALYATLCVLSVGIIAAVLAFYPLAPTVFMLVLILFTPVVTGYMSAPQPVPLSRTGKVVDMTADEGEDHNTEAWRETLL